MSKVIYKGSEYEVLSSYDHSENGHVTVLLRKCENPRPPQIGERWRYKDGSVKTVTDSTSDGKYVQFDHDCGAFGYVLSEIVAKNWTLVTSDEPKDDTVFGGHVMERDNLLMDALKHIRDNIIADTQVMPCVQNFTCCRCQLPTVGVPVDNGGTMCVDCARDLETR